jgi:hypothetical protein
MLVIKMKCQKRLGLSDFHYHYSNLPTLFLGAVQQFTNSQERELMCLIVGVINFGMIDNVAFHIVVVAFKIIS